MRQVQLNQKVNLRVTCHPLLSVCLLLTVMNLPFWERHKLSRTMQTEACLKGIYMIGLGRHHPLEIDLSKSPGTIWDNCEKRLLKLLYWYSVFKACSFCCIMVQYLNILALFKHNIFKQWCPFKFSVVTSHHRNQFLKLSYLLKIYLNEETYGYWTYG